MEISAFCDESGGQGLETEFYLITLVFHDQNIDLTDNIKLYEAAIARRGFDLIPFHSDPLLNGHGNYKDMTIEKRKCYLSDFVIFLQHLPVTYYTFAYRVSHFANTDALTNALRRDLVNFFYDNLLYFQSFDTVKVYYDNGQSAVTKALHDSVEYAIAKDAVVYRNADPKDYYLSQAADLICSMELLALKCELNGMSSTGEKFFGTPGYFKKNYLKKLRAKRLG